MSPAGWLLALALVACSAPPEARAPSLHARASDGVEIAYEVHGSGEPLLLFVHGWCCDRAFWRSTMAAFAPHHRVAALDLAGHGDSGAGRTAWTLASLADDVCAVVEALGAEQVLLVGHSMGAPVALLAAPRLAPRVLGVIAVDALHDADYAYEPGYLERIASALESDFPGTLDGSIRSSLAPKSDPELAPWIVRRATRTDRTAAVGLLRGLGTFELPAVLAAAGVPVRAINAAAEPPNRPATNVEGSRRYADFDAVVLEDCGHFPMLEQPDRFRALLAQEIEELSHR